MLFFLYKFALFSVSDLRGLWFLDKCPVIAVFEKTGHAIGFDHRLGYNLITYRTLLSLQLMLR